MNNTEIIDFNNLTPKLAGFYNEIAEELRSSYHHIIDSLSETFKSDINWWVTDLATRNIHGSSTFICCCQILMVKKLIEKKHSVRKVVVNSQEVEKVLNNYFQKNNFQIKVSYKNPEARTKYYIKRYSVLHFIASYINLIIYFIKIKFFATKIKSSKTHLSAEPITLLDVFVFENSFESNIFKDRYYPGLWNFLTEEEQEQFYYAPTFYGIENISKTVRELREAKQNFLLQEDYLKVEDYFWLFLYPIRNFKLTVPRIKWNGFDISLFIKKDLKRAAFSRSSWEGLLKYRFANRLKEAGVKLNLIFDWFENQNIDKGFNLGFRKYYPETPITGYQGFYFHNYYFCMHPTSIERRYKVIPQRIAVIGRAAVEEVKEFCPELNVVVSPAFRVSGIWKPRKFYPETEKVSILIALPYVLQEGNYILKIVSSILDDPQFSTYNFWVKYHPANKPEQIVNYFGDNWPDQFQLIDGDFNDWIEKANIFIGNAGTTPLESLSKGVPVIIIGNPRGLTLNAIPLKIEKNIWKLCYNSEELKNTLLFFAQNDVKSIKKQREIGKKIRLDYFEPVTKKSVEQFLQLYS